MIKPKPYTLKCPKCNYSKTVRPKSDTDFFVSFICPKCGTKLEREALSDLAGLWYLIVTK